MSDSSVQLSVEKALTYRSRTEVSFPSKATFSDSFSSPFGLSGVRRLACSPSPVKKISLATSGCDLPVEPLASELVSGEGREGKAVFLSGVVDLSDFFLRGIGAGRGEKKMGWERQ